MSTPVRKYDNVTVILHWVIGIGILLIAGLELVRHEFPKGHLIREGLKPLHQPAGTVVFALIMFRIMWRSLFARAPNDDAHGNHGALARLMHVALYVLMVALPLSGLIYVFGSDKIIDFGWFSLSLPLKAVIGSIARTMKDFHEVAGMAILVLGLAHAAAALVHHYGFKDGLLERMSLSRKPGARSGEPDKLVAAE